MPPMLKAEGWTLMRLSAFLLTLGLLLNPQASHASATSEQETQPQVRVSSESRDRFYEVHGNTADAVFASIGRKKLGNTPGRAASGLTESKMSYSLESTYGGDKPCRILDLHLKLDIVVTLPRHKSPAALDTRARRNWEIYETAVEAHEYRHVEIELRGLEELSRRLQTAIAEGKITAPGKTACANYVDELLGQQRALTRNRHEEFHRESAQEVRDLQAAARERLEKFDTETRRDQETLREFDDLLSAVRFDYDEEIAELPLRPSDQQAEAQRAVRILAEELNAAIEQRNQLLDEIRERHEIRATLVEDLLWIR